MSVTPTGRPTGSGCSASTPPRSTPKTTPLSSRAYPTPRPDGRVSAGEDATAAVRERVADREVTVVLDPASDGRGDHGRLLAYVRVDGTDLNRWLLAEGHARVYDSTFARSEDYYAVESDARDSGTGVWACRSPGDETLALGSGERVALIRSVVDQSGFRRTGRRNTGTSVQPTVSTGSGTDTAMAR